MGKADNWLDPELARRPHAYTYIHKALRDMPQLSFAPRSGRTVGMSPIVPIVLDHLRLRQPVWAGTCIYQSCRLRSHVLGTGEGPESQACGTAAGSNLDAMHLGGAVRVPGVDRGVSSHPGATNDRRACDRSGGPCDVHN